MKRKDPINIMLVFHGTELTNGGTRSFLDIVDFLNSTNEYHFFAVFPHETGTAIDYLRLQGISNIYTCKYGGLMQDLRQPWVKRAIKLPILIIRWLNIRREAQKMASLLRDQNISLVYSNTSSIVFGGYLGLFLNCKQAWHIREYRKLDHQIQYFWGDRCLKKFINKCSQKVFFVSDSVLKYHTDYIDPKKCFVTFNSYPKTFIKPREEFYETGELKLLLAGDVRPSKGQLEAIKAMALIHEIEPNASIKLLIVGHCGDHDYHKKLKSFIDSNYISSYVEFLGHRTDMDVIRSHSDIGLCTSNNEACGRTVIEGMLSMMAMIGRASGGTIEQIIDGKTGILYDGTPKDLAMKILNLYHNTELIKYYAENGFYYCVPRFTNSNSARIVKEQLDDILS